MNITIEDGTIERQISTITRVFSDSTKKDVLSDTKIVTDIIFKDKDGNTYPDGKIIVSDEYVKMNDYKYNRDENGNVLNCTITTSAKKNGKSIDIEKTTSIEYYDTSGKLTTKEFYTRDGIQYLSQKYEYSVDGKVSTRVDKGTDTFDTIKYNSNGDVVSIISETIRSKTRFKKYIAFFDSDNRIYKTIDGHKRIETDYERDFDGSGNMLSETKRFFDISTTHKKLISYVVTSYNPAANYKIASIIENGILKEKHEYDTKGEEIEMYKVEEGKELFVRTESSVDEDTGNKTIVTSTKIIEQGTGNILKDSKVKTVYDSDKKLISYSEDNTISSVYEYDAEGRRTSVTTKKLIDGEYVTINQVLYTYTTNETATVRTRQLTVYDKDGNTTNKEVHTETFDTTIDTYDYDRTIFESAIATNTTTTTTTS